MKWLNLTVNEMNDDSASLGAFSLPDTYSGVVKAVLSNLSNAMARNLPYTKDKFGVQKGCQRPALDPVTGPLHYDMDETPKEQDFDGPIDDTIACQANVLIERARLKKCIFHRVDCSPAIESIKRAPVVADLLPKSVG